MGASSPKTALYRVTIAREGGPLFEPEISDLQRDHGFGRPPPRETAGEITIFVISPPPPPTARVGPTGEITIFVIFPAVTRGPARGPTGAGGRNHNFCDFSSRRPWGPAGDCDFSARARGRAREDSHEGARGAARPRWAKSRPLGGAGWPGGEEPRFVISRAGPRARARGDARRNHNRPRAPPLREQTRRQKAAPRDQA